MRTWGCLLVLACGCSDDAASARLIAGGGVGDGSPDGTQYVYVIDAQTQEPLANVTVRVGDTDKMTDEEGFASFSASGKQTIAAKKSGYRMTAWSGVDGVNVTIPLTPLAPTDPPQATLTGGIDAWAQDLGTGHIKAMAVTYSQTDTLGDRENNLSTPNNGGLCFGINECNWTAVTRTGTVTLGGAIIDRDGKNTVAETDDTNTFIGFAFKKDIVVADGVNQSGIALETVEAGNLQTVSVNFGSPPAALTEHLAVVGIEIDDDQTLQIPLFLQTERSSFLAPKPTVLGADAQYRLTAIAQTTAGGTGASSIVLRQHQGTGTTLEAGDWLTPPTGVSVSRTNASWTPSAGAEAHSVQWSNSTDVILEITMFDNAPEVTVPALLELPTGTLTARVQALGVDFDVRDFSLEEDSDELWGIAAEPADVD